MATDTLDVQIATGEGQSTETLECELEDEEYDTIGGLVLHELGRLPRRGEKVGFGGFEFAVIKADDRRIDALQVQREGA